MSWGQFQYLSPVIEQVQAATVRITSSTAVMVSDRFAITAAHSPLDENNEITPNLTVQNLWGEVRKIINVFYDVERDFAIVELESPFEHAYAVRVASAPTQPGDDVFIVGNPATVANAAIGWAVAFGTSTPVPSDSPDLSTFDIDVWGGFSGSGIFNEKGELVSVLSFSWRDGTQVTPWFKENLPVQNQFWDLRNGRYAGGISLSFIDDFLGKYQVENLPKTDAVLPENRPDPENITYLTADELAAVETNAVADRLSSVLVSNSGADSPYSNKFSGGGSGTLLHDGLVLTVSHALDARFEASVGFYDRTIDPASKTYAVSAYGTSAC